MQVAVVPAVADGPAVLGLPAEDVLGAAAGGRGGGDDEGHRPFALRGQRPLQVLQHAHVAPERLAGHHARHMGEDVVGAEAVQVLGILQQQLAAGQLLLQADRRGRDAVVDQVDRLVGEHAAQEAQLVHHRVADREDAVADARALDHGVFVEPRLVAEDLRRGFGPGPGPAGARCRSGCRGRRCPRPAAGPWRPRARRRPSCSGHRCAAAR